MVNGKWFGRMARRRAIAHRTELSTAIHPLLLTIYYSLAFPLVHVRQRPLGGGARRRAVVQDGDLLERVEARPRLDPDGVWRRGRAGDDFYHGADVQSRWVDAVLTRGNHIVADDHRLQPRDVTHLKEPLLAEAAHRPERVRLSQLPDHRPRGRALVRDEHDLRRDGADADDASDDPLGRDDRHVEVYAGGAAAVDDERVEPDRGVARHDARRDRLIGDVFGEVEQFFEPLV